MAFGFFFGDAIKILRGKLNLFDQATLDGTSITANTVIIADANKNILSSSVAASALNALTGTFSANQVAFSNGTALTGSDALKWAASSNTLSVSGVLENVGSVVISQSQAASATLADNATTEIFTASTASYNSLEMSFSVTRGTNRRVGKAYVCQSGASADIASQFSEIGDCGITFSTSVVAGVIGVSATLTSTGTAATIVYTNNRWLG